VSDEHHGSKEKKETFKVARSPRATVIMAADHPLTAHARWEQGQGEQQPHVHPSRKGG
jgi:hypothetical protein